MLNQIIAIFLTDVVMRLAAVVKFRGAAVLKEQSNKVLLGIENGKDELRRRFV